MPQDGNQPKGWRGDGNQPKRTAKYGWKPKSAGIEKSLLMRRVTQVSLALSVFMCIAVIVYIIYQLRPPEKTSIIIIAARPSADAINLQAPLDFHGWEGCRKLMHYVSKDVAEAEILPRDNAPFSLTNETLPKLEALVRDNKTSKKVIIYFGLLGFAGQDGPCLFGSQGKVVKVRDIIEKLAPIAESTGRDVLLLFDAARLPVAPELGILRNDFVRSLEDTLGKDIRNMKHLAVICSSSPGERAWNSDEWGCSVFLQQVIEALRGATKAKSNSNDIKLTHFFDTVRDQTRSWSKLRFVSEQIPIRIVAEKMDPVIVVQRNEFAKLNDTDKDHNAPGYEWVVGEKAETPFRLQKLKTNGEHAAELAKTRPHPAVYTPLSWRRYRELLVRLEQALRMNDNEAADALDLELSNLNKAIRAAQALKFSSVSPTSTIWPVVLAGSQDEVRMKAQQAIQILAKAPNLAEAVPIDAESHLAFKLAQFWDKRSNPPSKDIVKLAIETRQLAERAALGCPVDSAEYYYSERLWEWIQAELKVLDVKRRIAEDYLFSDNHPAGEKILNEVKQEYAGMITKFKPLQSAWAMYHYAVSEATFLTKWHIYCAEELQEKDSALRMQQLWGHIHRLEDDFRTVNLNTPVKEMEEVAKSCREIERLVKYEMKQFIESVRVNIEKATGSQNPRHQLELLLAFPWPIPKDSDTDRDMVEARLNSIIKTRLAGRDLHKTEGPSTNPTISKDLNKIVQYRGELMNSMLERENENFDGSAQSALKLGNDLISRYQLMADDGTDKDKRLLKPELAEKAARYTLSFTGVPREIALNRRDERYRTLLREHAKRICLDHWYNGKEQTPYFKKTASLYLDNEDFIVEKDPELIDLLEPRPLAWKPSRPEPAWTSELKRDWEIEVDNPHKRIEGRIALWAEPKTGATAVKPGQSPAIELSVDDLKRTSKPLNEAKSRLTLVARDIASVDVGKILLTFVPKAYFRGQELDGEVPITLSRQPALIVTEHTPKEGGTFTLTKAKNLRVGLGHLAIVLDYSRSMRVSKKSVGDNDWDWKRDDSRIWQAISGLNTLLLNLSENVDDIDLSIRVFSEWKPETEALHKGLKPDGDPLRDQTVKELTEKIESTLMFVGKLKKQGEKRVLVPQDSNKPQVTLDQFISQLKQLIPFSSTPLLKSMVAAKESLANNENVTLLVLTDGADTSLGELEKENDPRIEAISQSFQNKFADSGLSIKIILFTNDDTERKIARKQFKEFVNDKSRNSVRDAIDSQALLNELRESFKVRMQVTKNGQVVHSNEKDDPQYFIAREENTPLGSLVYSPFLTGDNISRVWINDKQQLSFSAGDHLFIKLKDAKNKVKYTRELFKDVLKLSQPEPSERYIQGQVDGKKLPWHLTVAENRDPGHLRVTLEHDSNLVESSEGTSPVLSMYRPNFVWWDVKAIGEGDKEQNPQGTVHITNLPYYLAPGWDIDQGPTQDKQLRIQAWVSENTVQKENLLTFDRGELKNDNVLKPSNRVAVSREKHYLTDGTQRTSDQVSCLVVRYRVTDHANQRVWFDITANGVKRKDHYYFPEAQTMTVYFSPFNPDDAPDEKITLKTINLDELTRQLKKPVINARIPMNQSWHGPSIDIK